MDYNTRKVLRQISNAADQTDIESACKALIMVLKKKAQFLPNRHSNLGDVVIFSNEKEDYVISYELLRLILITEPPASLLKSKL
jgi:hypothetical protein